mgnify:CR=1 FL=1
MKNYQIVLYSMEGCPYCDELKGYLQNEGMDYKPIDIEEKILYSYKKLSNK